MKKLNLIWIVALITMSAAFAIDESQTPNYSATDLSTGETATDIGIPIPKFSFSAESTESIDNWKYFIGMNQIGENTFQVVSIRLWMIIVLFMGYVIYKLANP